jgi:two-component sensor histidine kinase
LFDFPTFAAFNPDRMKPRGSPRLSKNPNFAQQCLPRTHFAEFLMTSTQLLLISLLFTGICAHCQSTGGSLDVPNRTDTTPVATQFARLHHLPPDSIKMNLLLGLSDYYWRLGKGRNLDTCLSLATQAYALGLAIHSAFGTPEAVFMQAKVHAERNEMQEARRLLPLVYGEQRVRVLLVMAEQYINRKPVDLGYIDAALPYAQHALDLADSIHSDRWRNECLLLMGKYYFEKGDIKKGGNSILTIINACRRAGNRVEEAHYWAELDLYMPRTDSTYPDHLRACRNAYQLYNAAGEKEQALFALRDWAMTELGYDHLDSAEKKFDTVLTLFRNLKKEPTPATYLSLADLYVQKGDFPKSLNYAQKALEGFKPTDQRKLMLIYSILSESSLRLGETDDGLRYARLSMDFATANNLPDMFYVTRLIVDGLIRKDSAETALRFLRRFETEHPPKSPLQERVLSYCYAVTHDHLGQHEAAERYFVRMIQLGPATKNELRHSIFTDLFFSESEAAISIAKFYIRWGKNREALTLLLQTTNNPSMARQVEDRRMVELLLFQVYLALGDTHATMLHHTRFVTLTDSIFNVEKLKEFQTLQVRYETRQKEQALQLLQLQSQKEQAQLRETNQQRNVTLGAVVLLLILSVMAWRGYQMKQQNLFRVQVQQDVIRRQSQDQLQLLEEKDRLLTDKDLLMQEIHHRMKNNLSIIISLLESQSLYLNNPAAQAALQDTQNRIQAVFLLHQKLYRASEGTDVDATSYVLELVNHLCETFDTRNHNITITHHLEPISLDALEILPLGVILNEAITNTIKHAFPGHRTGHVHLSLLHLPSGEVQLQIRDNGIGLPAEFRHDEEKSLGFTLIDGLVNQLHGNYSIGDDGGVVMTIRFKPRSAYSPIPRRLQFKQFRIPPTRLQ